MCNPVAASSSGRAINVRLANPISTISKPAATISSQRLINDVSSCTRRENTATWATTRATAEIRLKIAKKPNKRPTWLRRSTSSSRVSSHHSKICTTFREEESTSFGGDVSSAQNDTHDGNDKSSNEEGPILLASSHCSKSVTTLRSGTNMQGHQRATPAAKSSSHPSHTPLSALDKKASCQQQIDMALDGWKMMPFIFDIFDADSDGTVDRSELLNGMERMIGAESGFSISLSDVERIMGEIDLDNDHVLDRREFGCFLSRVARDARVSVEAITSSLVRFKEKEAQQLYVQSCARAWRKLPALFSAWDFDGSGTIEGDELVLGVRNFIVNNKDVTSKLTLAECLQLMHEVDENDDKVLDRREFYSFVARFTLSTGVPMDRVVESLMEDCKAVAEKKAKKFGSFFAKIQVSLAEEVIIESHRTTIRGNRKTLTARGA